MENLHTFIEKFHNFSLEIRLLKRVRQPASAVFAVDDDL